MKGDLYFQVAIPKPLKLYDIFHTEFIVNLLGDDRPDLTYKQFKHIMMEMGFYGVNQLHELWQEPYPNYDLWSDSKGRRRIEEWIRDKICWKEQQYVIDKIYEGNIQDYFPSARYLFVTLKQIIYTTDPKPLKHIVPKSIGDVIAKEIPTHPQIPSITSYNEMFDIYVEGDPLFDDKFIVIRRRRY